MTDKIENLDFLEKGYTIFRKGINPQDIEDIHRLIQTDILNYGLSLREIKWWKEQACWFPHLREHINISKLLSALPAWVKLGIVCEPQILLSFPDSQDYEPSPHIDQEPPWANGKKYRLILGIPLTPFNKDNGGVRFWPLNGGSVFSPELDVQDAFVMNPQLPHSGGPNLCGGVRYALYLRFLED